MPSAGHTDVNADVSRFRFVAELARRRAAGGEQTGLVAILSAVDELDGLIDGIHVHETQDRSEDLCLCDLTPARHIGQDRGSDEIASLIALDGSSASIDGESRSFLNAKGDQLFDPGLACRIDDGSHLDAGIQPVAYHPGR